MDSSPRHTTSSERGAAHFSPPGIETHGLLVKAPGYVRGRTPEPRSVLVVVLVVVLFIFFVRFIFVLVLVIFFVVKDARDVVELRL